MNPVEEKLRNVHLTLREGQSFSTPYHGAYIPYDYQWPAIDVDASKAEFVNFRKKQLEKSLHEPQRDSRTTTKKYQNEWHRLTATTDVESVMERAAHFEEIDPEKFPRFKAKGDEHYSPSVSLLRHDSYITAVQPRDFALGRSMPQTPVLRRKAEPDGTPKSSETEMKQRRASYLLATDQQSQAIKKLKNFFGEGSPQVAQALEQRSFRLSNVSDCSEPSKEGILYCKTVLKDGRRALDRSWRGAWAVLRRGALFLGKEKRHGLLIPLSYDSFPINLRDAQVEVANDYMKKPRVFKLLTGNQSEFLFQAPDLQSLNEWLEVINEQKTLSSLPPQSSSSKLSPSHASPRRSFVKSIVKKGLRTLKSSSSLLSSQMMSGQIYDESSGESLLLETPSLSQGRNFAIELEECESSSLSQFIPIVVEILTRLVELRGIASQGIYRHAGGLTAVNWLVNELDKGTERIELNSERWYDVKAVASTLKTFFAKLPDSLLSSSRRETLSLSLSLSLSILLEMSSLCVEASRIETHRPRLIELKRMLVQLDDHRFETLKYLCAHFRRVAAKCDVNKVSTPLSSS